ncbi:ComEC/Rec2 family competence protein [Ascidiaceihabitans sp.]|uniref:ComEC/Rec2 family competence protein n=1 Tax=Ascidiaceihabitans sp. TaxID=1872644 RepID=UPI003298CA02
MRALVAVGGVWAAQRGHLFAWVPVCLAIGIGAFFSLRFEPSLGVIGSVGMIGAFAATWGWHKRALGSPLAIALFIICAGFVGAAWRAHSVAGPILGWRYYGAIEGRVIAMDRSSSDAVRLTLDAVTLDDVSPRRTPLRVRISLHGDAAFGVTALPGMRIMTTGHLSPPGGPVEPGGFNFQRHAWFGQLGAVGYTRVPLVAIKAPKRGDMSLMIFRLRMAISARVQQTLPGDVGGFAAAVTTGDRSALSKEALNDLRASNTAHLIAISGLHMGLLSGFVFALLRIVIALIQPLALRISARKWAAGGALCVAAVYLALSGGNVSTERAFIMVAVALTAVMCDRRAISLRAVAMAAIIVLVLQPEAMLGPGFQMSFAATTALVAVFGWMRDAQIKIGPDWAQPVVGVVLSSAIAGLATAPIGAAHFNAVAHYGLVANLLSVPLMGMIVIPAAVFAALLAPFGLESLGLWVMGLGLQWILGVADWVAALDGARGYVAGPGPWVLPVMALGGCMVIIWHGRLRWLGAVPVILAFAMWGGAQRPTALIADNGSLVGVMTDAGRALSKAKGAGFVARNWLENDGDPSSQSYAAGRWPGEGGRLQVTHIGSVELVHVIGKKAASAVLDCDARQLLVASAPLKISGCPVYDPQRLRQTGAVALFAKGDGLDVVTVRDMTGDRLWSNWAK